VADPDSAVCTPEEQQYILDSLAEVFPARTIDAGAIVSTFSGVRPLMAGDGETKNEMSRDHACTLVSAPGSRLPIYSMPGGKWTTFRSFAAEMADIALGVLGRGRVVSTQGLPIGGGRDYPSDDSAREAWAATLADTATIPIERARDLLRRYGTTAADVAKALGGEADRPLSHCHSYSTAELDWIIGHEHVRRLDDLVLRRTSLALLGEVTMPLLEELSHQLARHLGLSELERMDTVAATAGLLHQRYAVDIREGQPA
jgi:glycerol-3-phosphate dehydrogenase